MITYDVWTKPCSGDIDKNNVVNAYKSFVWEKYSHFYITHLPLEQNC